MVRVTVSLNDDVKTELDFLSTLYRCSKSQLIENLIRLEYNQSTDNEPKIKELVSKLDALKDFADRFQDIK